MAGISGNGTKTSTLQYLTRKSFWELRFSWPSSPSPSLGPWSPYDYEEFAGRGYQPPSKEHWFGTTIMGRDVFTQVVFGLRSTLLVGFLAGTIASAIGLVVGFVSGFFSGKAPDEGLMALTNIFMVIPSLTLLIILSAYLPYRGIATQAIIVAATAWPWTARAVRLRPYP